MADKFCPLSWVKCTNIWGSYGGVLAKDHAAGAGIDFSYKGFEKKGSAEIFENWLESDWDLVCEPHWNNTGVLAPAGADGSHLHCTDKWWKEQQDNPDILEDGTDLNKLAYAVAMAETADCTRGYGTEYNNCFGIKNGNTAPCPKTGNNRMCIYETKEESYEAFKKIWATWYKTYPSYTLASRWTSEDNVQHWIQAVNQYYNLTN